MSEPAKSCPHAMELGDLLLHCPACDYRLEGLPVEHACPECGLSADRRWRVFGGRRGVFVRSGRTIAVAAASCFFGVSGLLGAWHALGMGNQSAMWANFLGALMFLSFLPDLWRPGSFLLAVGPRGIYAYQDRGHVDYWGWTQVMSSREQLVRGDLRIETGARRFT